MKGTLEKCTQLSKISLGRETPFNKRFDFSLLLLCSGFICYIHYLLIMGVRSEVKYKFSWKA